MVVTDAPARMSRTEEVHRITENVYKVRRTLRWLMSPQRDVPPHLLHLVLANRQMDGRIDGLKFVQLWSAAVTHTFLALSVHVRF